MILSDSLSLSSYSSWLLPPALEARGPIWMCIGPFCRSRLRRRALESCWTRKPVVMISSFADDKEEDEGCDDSSTQESEGYQ